MNWFGRLVRGKRMESELDKELRFHMDTQVAEKMRSGMSEAEARRAVRLEFGGMTQVKEKCRESRGTEWVRQFAQDMHYGARILARALGFSFTAITVLALGIGVTTLAFSLYNLAALQTLPVRDAASIVRIERRSPGNITPGVPYVSIAYYREHATTISAFLAAMQGSPMAFDRDEKKIQPSFVSANYFRELGGEAAGGRFFDRDREEAAGAAPVAVLSYAFWQRRFAGDTAIIGKNAMLGGKPATVIGVAAKNFANLGTDQPDVWLPLPQISYFVEGSREPADPKFEGNVLLWGRLATGATPPQAAEELLALTNQLRPQYPQLIWDQERILVTPGAHFFSFDGGTDVLTFISALVFLVLFTACANLGGLLSARGASRRHEIQLRTQLGAGRLRLFRQLLTENLLLGLLGAAVALPLSVGVLRLALNYADAPAWMSATPDWRVFAFAATMGFLSALLFGLLPTVQLVRRPRKGKGVWHQFIVCAQVGASCVLLIVAGLLVRATIHTIYAEPGFAYQQVVSIEPELSDHGFTPARAEAYLDDLSARLARVPGVDLVSIVLSPPLVNRDVRITSVTVDGRKISMIYPNWVSAKFFETMGIPLLRGRYLRDGESHAVVLSRSLAAKRWPGGEDPIGKAWNTKGDVVVGVVGDTRAMEMNNTDETEIYFPTAQDRMPEMSALVRTAGGGSPEVLRAIATTAEVVDPHIKPTVTPLRAGYQKTVTQAEQVASIASLLGGTATFLAVVGLLGLISYAVSQRTRELAIRQALGAGRREIFAAIARRFAWPVAIGLALGVAATAGISQLIRRALYGVSGLDPASYVGAIALLLGILGIAAMLPLRRAFRIDIARTLHFE
jgi:predicted permease